MAPKNEVQNIVVDAFGKYHDLAKGAFDAFSNTHGGLRPQNFFDLVQKPLKESGKKLLDNVGFDTSKILAPIVKNVDAATSGAGELLKELKAFADAPLGHPMIRVAVEAVAGGPLGVAFMESAKQSYDYFHKKRKDRQPNAFKRGQWVILNMGVEVEESVYDFDADFFGKPVPIQGVHQDIPEDAEDFGKNLQINVGFFIEQVSTDRINCFDLAKLQPIEMDILSVAPATTVLATKMDSDVTMSEIRELFFVQAQGAPLGMASDVNVDPGSEVIFKEKRYNVVRAVLSNVLIEDVNGKQYEVDVGQLKPGRRTNTQSYAYLPDGTTAGSFNTTLDGWHQGQWVWVNTARFLELEDGVNSQYELGVIHDINESVNVYLAMDGTKVSVAEGDLLKVGLGFADLWGGKTNFQRFRDAAVVGYGTERLAIGSQNPNACLGIDSWGGMKLVEPEFDAIHCGVGPRRLMGASGTVISKPGDCTSARKGSLVRKVPGADGIIDRGTAAQEMHSAKNMDDINDELDRQGGQRSGVTGDQETDLSKIGRRPLLEDAETVSYDPSDDDDPTEKTDNTMVYALVGGVLVVGLFLALK